MERLRAAVDLLLWPDSAFIDLLVSFESGIIFSTLSEFWTWGSSYSEAPSSCVIEFSSIAVQFGLSFFIGGND